MAKGQALVFFIHIDAATVVWPLATVLIALLQVNLDLGGLCRWNGHVRLLVTLLTQHGRTVNQQTQDGSSIIVSMKMDYLFPA